MRWVRWLALLPAAATVLFAVIAVSRATLPYNSEGRYFDAANSVVYHEGAEIAYGAMAIFGLALAAAVWFGFSRFGQQRPSPATGKSGAAPVASPRIEYLIRADGGSDRDLIIDDEEALIPQTGQYERAPEARGLTVLCDAWSVQYSAEDPGWQLSFSHGAPHDDARKYVHVVAAQLAERTGVKTRCVQISGFD